MNLRAPTLRQRIERLAGRTIEWDLRRRARVVDDVVRRAAWAGGLSDEAMRAEVARIGEDPDARSAQVDLFALVGEAAVRSIGQRPFDEQMLAGLLLADGRVVEMATGEGKTLAAVAPVVQWALHRRGVHVLTFNDYLAERDARWMGPIYERLGLSVGFVVEGMAPAERRRAYRCDVTYLSAKESGFDFLRDHLCLTADALVHRPLAAAVVDEADSILIDEARVPLVIAGRRSADLGDVSSLADLARQLERGPDFDLDDHARNIFLTDRGSERAEAALGCAPLFSSEGVGVLADLRNALHAEHLLRRDVDYIVRNGRIELVDEMTGRVAENRHWPDGLHRAVEVKEGLVPGSEGEILGSITIQHFLQCYPRLAGMTATATAAADELQSQYGLSVAVVPTHAPDIRHDDPDLVFTHREAKEDAVRAEIHRIHATGRPILVGTTSVAESERLAADLRASGIACEVLNAKNDHEEARIVAGAGAPGAVTISTNMAGRGVDIRLGGHDESERGRVVDLGGLYVIGTNRHASSRIDRQLRGRAGRQGDPGASRFFVSLQDDLVQTFGFDNLALARQLPGPQPEPIEHRWIQNEIDRVQRIVEGEDIQIRRSLWQFADVVETQRRSLQELRQSILGGVASVDVLERRCPEEHEAWVQRWGADRVAALERRLLLLAVDEAWSQHLAETRRLREEIPLVTFVRKVPLAEFIRETAAAFESIRDRIDDDVVERFSALSPDELDLDRPELRGPSSTWTYLVSDDPYRTTDLAGLGHAISGAWAASVLWPLLLVTGLVSRKRRRER